VVLLEISDDEVVGRLGGRRVCSSCGAIYHVRRHPPKREGICDSCGGGVAQRSDDVESVIRDRLGVYHLQTSPLAEHYEKQGLLLRVDATGDVDAVLKRLESLGMCA
jgi:adenylate kinase